MAKIVKELNDWENADTHGTRFPESRFKCPLCKQKALEDNWPPNYGSYAGTTGGQGGFTREESSQKCVCVPCRVAFRVGVRKVEEWNDEVQEMLVTENQEFYSETVPLVEKDGVLLTPHDVWREEYKEEHGEYPLEAYA